MRFQKIGLTTVVLCTVGIQQSFSIDIVTKEKPNIVFILADDLGWTDLGVMGSDPECNFAQLGGIAGNYSGSRLYLFHFFPS